MQEQAIAKFRTEIEASNNPAVKAIGQFLLQHLEQNPDDAVVIMKEDKTIAKSLDAMREIARKKAVSGVAVLTDEEGFAIVLDYFKAETPAPAKPKPEKEKAAPDAGKPKREKRPKSEPKPEPKREPQPEPEEDDEDFDFDSLLE